MAAGPEFLLVQLAVIYVAAQLMSYAATLAKVPPLVGKILAGVVLANTVAGDWIDLPGGMDLLAVLAELGVVFLIFTVGLETDLGGLLKVGPTSVATAILGVVVPFAGGAGLFWALGYPTAEALFVGVAMVATSVAITGRVLTDLGVLQSLPARIILGAAVLDDVLGLLLLTVVSSVAVSGVVSAAEIAIIVGSALAFFAIAALLGRGAVRLAVLEDRTTHEPHWAGFLRRDDFPVILAVSLCLALSALATEFRLAPIVGAFLAGLLFDTSRGKGDVTHRMETLTAFLSPFFFVFIGASVDLGVMRGAALLVVGVTALAIATKVVGCGLGALRSGRATALAVGIGMAPRGEVGIIVALLGLELGIVRQELYGVVVAMSVLTTVAAPVLLQWALGRIPPDEEAAALAT